MISEIWIENSKGERIDAINELMVEEEGLLPDETIDIELIESNQFVFANQRRTQKASPFTWSINFTDDEIRNRFERFVFNYNESFKIRLKHDETWYYFDVKITGYTEASIRSFKDMERYKLNLTKVSNYIVPKIYDFSGSPRQDNGYYYGMNYEFYYNAGLHSAKTDRIKIENNGNDIAPIRIEIMNESNDPSWQLEGVEGMEALSELQGEIFVSVNKGQKLIVDSSGTQEMAIIREGTGYGKVNVYQNQNFQKSNFLYAPQGLSVLVFTNVIKVRVILFEQYKSLIRG